MAKPWESERYMRLLYLSKRMTPQEMADKMGTTQMTVYRWLKKHGIKK